MTVRAGRGTYFVDVTEKKLPTFFQRAGPLLDDGKEKRKFEDTSIREDR